MKKILVIILGVIMFLLILLGVTFLESLKKKSEPTTEIAPSPIITRINTSKVVTNSSAKKALEIAIEKPALQQKDLSIKNSMVGKLTESVSVIYHTDLVQIKYVKGPNDFEAKIISTDVKKAKDQTIQYFRGLGLSNDGICKLPLVFYPSLEVKAQLASEGKIFSLLPDFCL